MDNNEFAQALARRSGSVLSKDCILKQEHFSSSTLLLHSSTVFGAPNFRPAIPLHVYGVAQPELSGLHSLLRLLSANYGGGGNASKGPVVWCNSREEPMIYIGGMPFVVREASAPLRNIEAFAGISGKRLEKVEQRLKADILQESTESGLVIVHQEVQDTDNDGRREGSGLVPCWMAAREVKTSREVFEETSREYELVYVRIPISHGQSPFDSFIDELFTLFNAIDMQQPVVFSCGMGIGRTTFGMILGMLIRRWQGLQRGRVEDPLGSCLEDGGRDPSETTLRLVQIIEQSLGSSSIRNESAIQWILNRKTLFDGLKTALSGDYKVIVDLTRVLEGGVRNKMVVDCVIDLCSGCANLREQILAYRLKGIARHEDESYLNLALSYLERYIVMLFNARYFSLIVLNSYFVSTADGTGRRQSFGNWIRGREEIWNMFLQLRRHPNKLRAFRPIEDLEDAPPALLSPRAGALSAETQKFGSGNEARVVKERSGSILGPNNILKLDHWGSCQGTVEGAPNLRQISADHFIYATAQPTVSGLEKILNEDGIGGHEKILWINVREEPIVYINGEPYVLRDQWASLRNIKAYSGIAAERVEAMEDRLREDVMEESKVYGGRVLLHSEVLGSLIPLWEYLEDAAGPAALRDPVLTPKALFARHHQKMVYVRVPITAEEPPEPQDFDTISAHIASHPDHAIVFNCQMGVGRSTMGAVIAMQYLTSKTLIAPHSPPITATSSSSLHYALVNDILRGTRNGVQLKVHLDQLVDTAAGLVNLRSIIEEQRQMAEAHADPKAAAYYHRKSVASLQRYCMLLLFQSFLGKTPLPGGSFASWLLMHPEYGKVMRDAEQRSCIEMLTPGATGGSTNANAGDGVQRATLDDIAEHVAHRRQGSVLAPMTILKYDHFPGCQKQSLPERIEGAPNFRTLSVGLPHSVHGVAMPTAQAIPHILARLPHRRVLWVCLREEPVAYVNGRPFVLRRVKYPVANLEMTGIIKKRVESMEDRLRTDIEREAKDSGMMLLLHDEDECGGGMVAVWERIGSLETMRQVYERQMTNGGDVKLQYERIPITDEQAPIPGVFDHMHTLIRDCIASGEQVSFVYNCQMGRGRTTTGMVMTCMILHVHYSALPPLPSRLPPSDVNVARGDGQLLHGHYKLIDKLLAVLQEGRRAKQLVDAAADVCSHLQNLRECIYDMRGAGEGCRERGVNYLVRYFYLIAFGGYLLESQGDAGPAGFEAWLQERREITNLVSSRHSLALE